MKIRSIFCVAIVSLVVIGRPVLAALEGEGSGLAAWWKFDDGSGGIATDSSGNGNSGILIGNPQWTSGYIGGALSFNGITDYIRIPRSASLLSGPKTVAVWVNVGDFLKLAAGIYSWGWEGCKDTYYGPIKYEGNYIVYYQNGDIPPTLNSMIRDKQIAGPGTFKLGRWDHYAIVYSTWSATNPAANVVISLYKNGQLLQSSVPKYPYEGTDGLSSACGMRNIGSQEDYPNPDYIRTFSGLMDDYRVYNRALSASEILALYNQTVVPSVDISSPTTPSGLVATAVSSSKINLSWSASSDNVGVAGYNIYRNGASLATVRSGTTYVDTAHSPSTSFAYTLTTGTAYSYTVAAYDAAGNLSSQSGSASATTPTTVATDSATLTVTMVGTDFNTNVYSRPAGLNCTSGTCSYSFRRNTSVVLTPYQYGAPNNASITINFTGWSGDDCVGNGSCQIIMDTDKTVIATYGTVVPDTTAPTVTTFVLPSTTSALAVPITSLIATDTRGVTGYKVTESATPPSATATGWSASAPTIYTFSTAGSKTLYAYAKDAAGNVSAGRAASVVITIDSTPPVVESFTIPADNSTLTITIASLTASDAVGVTGFMLTESATPPSATATGWSASVPTIYTFSTAGSKTLYAYAKDAAGNVSTGRSASVVITLPASYRILNVIKNGAGTGTVVGGGIGCGIICSVGVADGTSVTLTASAATGSLFSGWSGSCSGTGTCSLAMNTDVDVTATFAVAPDDGGGGNPGGVVSSRGKNVFNPLKEGTMDIPVPTSGSLDVTIYDHRSQKVKTLLNGEAPLTGTVNWNGKNEKGSPVVSGVYMLLIKSNGTTEKRKIVVVR